MTPADKRVLELLDRWLTSIELHLKYVDLDEPGYQQVQPWPVHERPAKWMLELAQQKVLQLKALCKTQFANQDPVLAESLELMAFLANLVGAQNIRRFIPLADPANEQKAPPPPVTAQPASAGSAIPIDPPQPTSAPQLDATREMPQISTKAASAAKSEVEHTRGDAKTETSGEKARCSAASFSSKQSAQAGLRQTHSTQTFCNSCS